MITLTPPLFFLLFLLFSLFFFLIIACFVGGLFIFSLYCCGNTRNITQVFMEIDLNHAVVEVEKDAYCNGNCDKGGCVCCLSSSTSSCSSNSSSAPFSSSIYLELWHACAGPLTSLPKKGNVVVYFPQGHLEQVASSSPFSPMEMPTFDLQPQIFCKVVNVQLLVSTGSELFEFNCFCLLLYRVPTFTSH